MNRIEKKFAELRPKNKTAFIAYITAGDPSLEATEELICLFESNGVDIVELGIPFSDPMADGPVNQEASERALAGGATIEKIFDMVASVRTKSQMPLMFFAYYNTILSYGLEKFAEDAEKAGLDGVLVLDLPPEEAALYKSVMERRKISTVFLISPITPENRLKSVAETASGFVYYVSRMGVTGERKDIAENLSSRIDTIRLITGLPVAVGFGVSSPEHVGEISKYADGVVVGSSIVKKIAELASVPGFEKAVAEYTASLAAPLKGDSKWTKSPNGGTASTRSIPNS